MGLCAGEWPGKVIGVKDGDTLEILKGRTAVVVRLDGVDCPELGQAYGRRAKEMAGELAHGRMVKVEERARDRYGRLVGVVRLPDGRDLGSVLVEQGLAWWYRKYAPKDGRLRLLEESAREKRRGLWQEDEPVPPWVWRAARGGRVAQ